MSKNQEMPSKVVDRPGVDMPERSAYCLVVQIQLDRVELKDNHHITKFSTTSKLLPREPNLDRLQSPRSSTHAKLIILTFTNGCHLPIFSLIQGRSLRLP